MFSFRSRENVFVHPFSRCFPFHLSFTAVDEYNILLKALAFSVLFFAGEVK